LISAQKQRGSPLQRVSAWRLDFFLEHWVKNYGYLGGKAPKIFFFSSNCGIWANSLHCKGALSCFFNKFLDDHLHNCCDSKMLRFVLNFEFWSFEFVSDFGFSASDLVAAERSEAAPKSLCPSWPLGLWL
jgi:hypothetical protein